MISFCIPYRYTDDYRKSNFDFVVDRLRFSWPDGEVIIGDSSGEVFNRSEARNNAANSASYDVLCFVDADAIVSTYGVDKTFERLGEVEWAFPFDCYYELSPETSDVYRTEGRLSPSPTFENVFPSDKTPEPSVGGAVMVTKGAFSRVGGYDERFQGWGEEDRAFALALSTLVSPENRTGAPILHLWHPAPEALRFGQPNFAANRELCNLYREASGNKAAMEKVIF